MYHHIYQSIILYTCNVNTIRNNQSNELVVVRDGTQPWQWWWWESTKLTYMKANITFATIQNPFQADSNSIRFTDWFDNIFKRKLHFEEALNDEKILELFDQHHPSLLLNRHRFPVGHLITMTIQIDVFIARLKNQIFMQFLFLIENQMLVLV